MGSKMSFYWSWVLASGLASMFAWAAATWFFSSSLARSVFEPGYGPVVIGLSGAVATVAASQWIVLRKAEVRSGLLPWMAAMQLGFWVGLPFALFGAFSTIGPVQVLWFVEYSPEGQRLLWPTNVFLGTGLLAGIPAGIVAGPLHQRALRRGRLLLWMGVSTCAWLVAFGLGGLWLAAVTFPSAFGLHPSLIRAVPVATGGIAGGLAGLVHAAVLGLYLARVTGTSVAAGDRSSSPTQQAG